MELYQLRSFITVANEGHLTRAAKRLFISQPAVSAHIKTLEEELGVMLFTRSRQGMQLTPEGVVLKVEAEKSLETVNNIFHKAKRLQDDLAEVVKIGLNTGSDFLRVGDFFSVMTENYPKLEFHLLQYLSWEVLNALQHEHLDAGYTYINKTSPDIAVVPLRTFNLRVVGPQHWKERLETAEWEDILEFPWVLGAPDCPYYRSLNEIFQAQGVTPSKVAVTDEESIKTLVASGAGLAMLIEEAAFAAEQEGRMAVWTKDALPIDLSFAYLQKREHDPVIQAILNGLFIVWNLRNQAGESLASAREQSRSFHEKRGRTSVRTGGRIAPLHDNSSTETIQ